MRKSISVTFFSMVATLLVLGTAVLGCSEWLLFSRYFAQERYDTLDSVADVTQRAADYIVQQAALPKGAELDALNTKLEIIGESAEAYLFFTDEEGRVLIASNPEMVGTDIVGPELMKKVAGDQPYHTLSTLDGVLTEKSYVSVRHMQDARGNNSGYLFLCSSGARLTDFKEEFCSNFFFSACVMLLCASVLTSFLMRKLTDPLQKITDAAQRFGGGDFSVRVEGVEGEGEVVDLAHTFNQMAENIQSNDNSRGQFMGNIAHELRTPMTTIKGFIDGILDGTIDMIATDHAPHSKEEKERSITAAPSGIIGLETSLALGITSLVRKGHLSLMQLLEKMTINPARLYHLDGGKIEKGAPADLVIFDPEAKWIPEFFASMSSNSPFIGWELYGKVKMTVCGGEIVYTAI